MQKLPSLPMSFMVIMVLTNIFQALFTVNNGIAQILMNTQGMTAGEFAFARSFFNMIAAYFMLKQQKISLTQGIEKEHLPALYLRCGVGTICFIIVMYILKILPLTIFFMIFQTAPCLTVVTIQAYMVALSQPPT